MKTNAIIRIILYSLAILVLTGILLTGLGISQFAFSTEHTELTIPEGMTAAQFDASQLHSLDIEWVAGTITLRPSPDVSMLTVTEPAVEDPKYQMICTQEGSTLNIEFYEEDKFPFLTVSEDLRKDLEILVPEGWNCRELEIDTAAADLRIRDMTIETVDFDGAAGLCVFESCQVGQLELDTASGDIRFTGSLDSLDCDAMSANCQLALTNTPRRIDVDSMSGDITLTLPADCGFTASLSAMSGDFHSDFPTTTRDGDHIFGSGICRIDLDAISGRISILKG